MRTNRPQYINAPPSVPEYLYKSSSIAFEELVKWAKNEYQAWLIYLSEGGHWKSLKKFNDEVSPYRILAEMSGFRKMCSLITPNTWNKLSMRDRVFIRRAFELRDILLR